MKASTDKQVTAEKPVKKPKKVKNTGEAEFTEKVIWTTEHLERMWRLRYEEPTHTYDQLAKIFRKDDTWHIVNVLSEMRTRDVKDRFNPIVERKKKRGKTGG